MPDSFVSTGIHILDERLGGLPRQCLTVIHGNEAYALAISIARHNLKEGKSVSWYEEPWKEHTHKLTEYGQVFHPRTDGNLNETLAAIDAAKDLVIIVGMLGSHREVSDQTIRIWRHLQEMDPAPALVLIRPPNVVTIGYTASLSLSLISEAHQVIVNITKSRDLTYTTPFSLPFDAYSSEPKVHRPTAWERLSKDFGV